MSLLDIFYKKEQENISEDRLTPVIKQNKRPLIAALLGLLPIIVIIVGTLFSVLIGMIWPSEGGENFDGFWWISFYAISFLVGLVLAIISLVINLSVKKGKPILAPRFSLGLTILEISVYLVPSVFVIVNIF